METMSPPSLTRSFLTHHNHSRHKFYCVRFPTATSETKPHSLSPITVAKMNKKRRSGSWRSYRPLLESMAFVASNLKVLPEPLNFLITELGRGGRGGGGKLGFWNGFGGDDGWGRNRRSSGIRIPVILTASCVALWIILDTSSSSSLPHWALLIFVTPTLVGVCSLAGGWRRQFGDWALGFCCGALLVGSGFLSEKLGSFSSNPLLAAIFKKTKRKRKRVK